MHTHYKMRVTCMRSQCMHAIHVTCMFTCMRDRKSLFFGTLHAFCMHAKNKNACIGGHACMHACQNTDMHATIKTCMPQYRHACKTKIAFFWNITRMFTCMQNVRMPRHACTHREIGMQHMHVVNMHV